MRRALARQIGEKLDRRGLVQEAHETVDIDSLRDFFLAEAVLRCNISTSEVQDKIASSFASINPRHDGGVSNVEYRGARK